MKQLWILNHYANVPQGTGGTRHFGLAKHLLGLGWQTTILAASVEHETGGQRLTIGETVRLEEVDGVRVVWLRTPKYRGNGADRVRNMLSYSLRVLLPWSIRDLPRPDVIIGSSVHPFAALSGALLASRFKVPFIFEVRDLWPQTLIDMGRLRAGQTLTKAFYVLERWLYRRSDMIVTVLPLARDYIEPIGIPASKIRWIPNGVELQDYPKPRPPQPRPNFTLMYFGAHGQANGLETVIRAMAHLKGRSDSRNIRLMLVGSGPAKPELQALARDLSADNVDFRDPVPKTEIPRLAATADCFVLSVLNKPNLYRFGISMNKLYDYLAAGRPIVMASNAASNPVLAANAGYVVPPEDPPSLAEAIVKMASIPSSERVEMGRSGRAYVLANHAFSHLAAELARTLDEVHLA